MRTASRLGAEIHFVQFNVQPYRRDPKRTTIAVEGRTGQTALSFQLAQDCLVCPSLSPLLDG